MTGTGTGNPFFVPELTHKKYFQHIVHLENLQTRWLLMMLMVIVCTTALERCCYKQSDFERKSGYRTFEFLKQMRFHNDGWFAC